MSQADRTKPTFKFVRGLLGFIEVAVVIEMEFRKKLYKFVKDQVYVVVNHFFKEIEIESNIFNTKIVYKFANIEFKCVNPKVIKIANSWCLIMTNFFEHVIFFKIFIVD